MYKSLKTLHFIALGAGFGGLWIQCITEAAGETVRPLVLGGLAASALSGMAMTVRMGFARACRSGLRAHLVAALIGASAAVLVVTPAAHVLPVAAVETLSVLGLAFLMLAIVCGVWRRDRGVAGRRAS